MSSNVALRYYLPKTVLEVAAQVRYVVAFDTVGGHLEPRVELQVRPGVVPDRTARCCTNLDGAVLESASLGVHLNRDGLIEAVGSHVFAQPAGAGGPVTRTSAGTPPPSPESAAAEAADLAHRAAWTRPGSLRAAFDRTHPRTAALIADLSARAEQFLAGMRMGDGPAEVETFGSALAVVERELAAADRMRREWIAAQGFDVRSGRWDVDLTAATLVTEPLPERLPADTAVVSGVAQVLARDYGVLIALVDPERSDRAPLSGKGLQQIDEILVRQPRPVTLAVYRRPAAGVDEPGVAAPVNDREWVRDDDLTMHLDAVDVHSPVDTLGPEGHLGGDRALHLSFHPAGSVRAFGVSSAAVVAGSAMSRFPGEAAAPEAPGVPTRSAVTSAALEAARLQLALLQASDEFTRLAATHAHGGEMATLEQDARFAALRTRP